MNMINMYKGPVVAEWRNGAKEVIKTGLLLPTATQVVTIKQGPPTVLHCRNRWWQRRKRYYYYYPRRNGRIFAQKKVGGWRELRQLQEYYGSSVSNWSN